MIFICISSGEIPFQIFLLIFLVGFFCLFVFNLILCCGCDFVYSGYKPYQIYDLQIFLQICGLSFPFLDSVLRSMDILNFGEIQIISLLLLVPLVAFLRNRYLILDYTDLFLCFLSRVL